MPDANPPTITPSTAPAAPAEPTEDDNKPMTRAEFAAERRRWEAEHNQAMAAMRRQIKSEPAAAPAPVVVPAVAPVAAPKAENTPPPVTVPPPQSAEQKRIEELERRDREREERAQKAERKMRENSVKSTLKSHGVNELGQRFFISEYADRIIVDDDGNVNFKESEDKVTPLEDYLNLWPQTSEGQNFLPAEKLPTSDGLKPRSNSAAGASARASGYVGLTVDQIMEKKKVDPHGFSEYLKLYPGDFDSKSAQFALSRSAKR